MQILFRADTKVIKYQFEVAVVGTCYSEHHTPPPMDLHTFVNQMHAAYKKFLVVCPVQCVPLLLLLCACVGADTTYV